MHVICPISGICKPCVCRDLGDSGVYVVVVRICDPNKLYLLQSKVWDTHIQFRHSALIGHHMA